MNIYDVTDMENHIERIAAANGGEIPDDMIAELVKLQMKSIQTITGLCKYIKSIDMFVDACHSEEDRIAALRVRAMKRKESIYKYLTPYVAREERIDAGTFKLSVRKSESVEINEDASCAGYTITEITEVPDKKLIKIALKQGAIIPGARLVEHDNLQIK